MMKHHQPFSASQNCSKMPKEIAFCIFFIRITSLKLRRTSLGNFQQTDSDDLFFYLIRFLLPLRPLSVIEIV